MVRPFAVAGLTVASLCFIPQMFSQTPANLDFARDVQPIFRQNCIGRHGPAKQNSGLRLDRKISVLKLGVRRVVPAAARTASCITGWLAPILACRCRPRARSAQARFR